MLAALKMKAELWTATEGMINFSDRRRSEHGRLLGRESGWLKELC